MVRAWLGRQFPRMLPASADMGLRVEQPRGAGERECLVSAR